MKADPEILAMARVDKILKGLSEPARFRVACWIAQRYKQTETLAVQECRHPPFADKDKE